MADTVKSHALAKLEIKFGHALEEAAQMLQDALGPDEFVRRVGQRLRPERNDKTNDRVRWLRGIPFRAILTTNFDDVLSGETPESRAYRQVLRQEKSIRWWHENFLRKEPVGAPVVKLHGDLAKPESVVLTRQDYRRLLYRDPGYLHFLRAVFASHTVLFLGFSLADAYLSELRSEALAFLGQDQKAAPVAYAVLEGIPDVIASHYLRNEGIQVLSFDRAVEGFDGFDRILKAIHNSVNPAVRFGRLLADVRILWVDREAAFERGENQLALDFLKRAADLCEGRGVTVDQEVDYARGVDRLATTRYDLMICRWGHGEAPRDNGEPVPIGRWVLERVRSHGLEVPVLIFASGKHFEGNRRTAMRLGAQGYYYSFGGLLRGIERVLTVGEEIP